MPFSSFSATSWFAPCCKRLVIALSWSCLQFTYFNWSERFLILQHLTCVIFSVYLNSLSHFKADEDGWMFHPLCLSYGRLLKGGLIRQEMYAHEQSVDDVSIISHFWGWWWRRPLVIGRDGVSSWLMFGLSLGGFYILLAWQEIVTWGTIRLILVLYCKNHSCPASFVLPF